MVKLSIIIPVYNVEKYLRKCLDSVIYPDLGGYEIIAVNDGSTDGSGAICAEAAARLPELVRTVTTPNGGLGHARSVGIGMARGEYLFFLDSDDSLRPGALPEMLTLLNQDFDICLFDFVTVNESGRELAYTRGCSREGEFSLADWPQVLFEPPNACCKLWRKSLYTQTGIGFPDRLWFEDLATSPRLYLHAKKILAVRKPWYSYLYRPGSITKSANIDRNLEIITAVDISLDYYRQMGVFEKYRPELEYMCFYHQLLTSTTRVNLLDRNSELQDTLLDDFRRKFPRYRDNPYIQSMPGKYKLLLSLIERRQHLALHLVMALNDKIKR